MSDRPCLNCGHPESHHSAGECWTTADGQQTWGETACPCSWAEFDPFDRDAVKDGLEWYWNIANSEGIEVGEPMLSILEAASWAVEVTEGDGIWWCERHQCRWGYAPNCGWSPRGEACPKSRRLLIEWEADGVAAPSFSRHVVRPYEGDPRD